MTFLVIIAAIGATVTGVLWKYGYFQNPRPEYDDYEVPITIKPVFPERLPEPIKQPQEAVPEPTKPMPSKREKLYTVAYSCIGRDMSPRDVAPDSLACAESINGVFKEAFGSPIGTGVALTSTAALYQVLKTDSRFEEVATPLPGDISIAPSGMSTKGYAHGHVGIWGKYDVMSNDSNTGLWLSNYTHEAWGIVFHKTCGFPVFHFRVID